VKSFTFPRLRELHDSAKSYMIVSSRETFHFSRFRPREKVT